MGVETAAADAAPTIPTTPTLPTTSCVCGKRAAVKTCDACALRYCHECCVRRHRHGAFARHIIVELAEPTIDGKHPMAATTNEGVGKTPTLAVANSNKSTASTPCDECQDRGAVVACGACELRFCSPCLTSVHAVGSMQSHEGTGSFVEVEPLEQEPTTGDDEDDPSQRHVAHAVDSLLQDDPLPAPRKPSLLSDAPFCHGTTDAADPDPDQELSPTPPAKASSSSALSPSDSTTTTASSSASSSSYDLWGSWSVRSFSGERSSLTSPPPLSGGASDWRAFRASSSSSPPPSLSLSLHEDNSASDEVSTIARSLRSLSFAANAEELEPAARPVAVTKRAPRPRSFSDYTSLGSVRLHDIWSERGPALQAETRITPPSIPTPAFSTVGDELSRSMKTTVASRHVIVRSHAGAFNASSLRRVLDTLSAYGPLASIREEFTGDGVLFCTFFQLKAAIGAVKLWFTNNNRSRVGASESSAFFSVPYELPNDINCATLLVHLHGPAVASAVSEMRQLCSRYGEVASVLERDANEMGAVPFLVEYNDARDVAAALSSLAGMLLPSGHVIAASRSHPPTFDMTKVQAFQESVEAIAVATQPPFLTRPKSFSESTSHLTSPSSTSSSSPLHGSFFETRTSSFRQVAELEATDLENFSGSIPGSRSTSPFTPSLAAAGSAWRVREAARPRSSSAFASLSTDGSSSSLLGDPFAPSPARPSRYAPHQHSASYRTLPTTASSGSLNPHALMLQGRMGPIRIGSDPGFRGSYAASTASSTTSSVGRNDQGTGEYSLSIEKVAAGDDTRTTLMVRNIPNKYTQQMLLAEINMHHHGQYDFFYLPIDFKNKCNMGYAFINFIEAASIVSFYQEFDSQKWTNFNSEKVCAISYARLQGKQAMITRFQNSSLLEKHESYRPLVFYSSGPLQGTPEPFPSPKPQSQPQPHLQHHPHGGHTFKKLPHQHHQYPSQYQHHQQSQMLLTTSDEYLLAAHTGRLYAHHQHHQPHQQLHHAAHVLHGHALLANAHAAAAAMLHTMPGLGMQQPAQCSAPPPRAGVHYGHAYQLQPDHRHGQPFMNGSGVLPSSRPAHHSHSAFSSFSGASYSSSSSTSS